MLNQLCHFKFPIHVCFGRVDSCFGDRGSDMQRSGNCGKTRESSVSNFGILLQIQITYFILWHISYLHI